MVYILCNKFMDKNIIVCISKYPFYAKNTILLFTNNFYRTNIFDSK